MANKFPCAVGNGLGDGLKQSFIQSSGDFNAERTIGRGESFLRYSAAKLTGKTTQDADLDEARPETGSCKKLAGTQRKSGTERVSYRAHATIPGCTQQGAQDLRKNVRVLMSVDVRNCDASRLNLLNLRFRLGLNFRRDHPSGEGTRGKRFESVTKSV